MIDYRSAVRQSNESPRGASGWSRRHLGTLSMRPLPGFLANPIASTEALLAAPISLTVIPDHCCLGGERPDRAGEANRGEDGALSAWRHADGERRRL